MDYMQKNKSEYYDVYVFMLYDTWLLLATEALVFIMAF